MVNQIDHKQTHFEENFQRIKQMVGNNAVKVQYPIVVDGAQCIIDVLKMKMYKFGPEGGKPEKFEIPESEKALADELHNELVEKVPEQMVGNVMTELQSRRSMILGIDTNGSFQILKSITPSAELYDFSTPLRSITQGRATFSSKFSSNQNVPSNVQKELINK